MIKKIGLFIAFFLCITKTYADTLYPVDTIALDEALKVISQVGDSTAQEDIENAQANLFMYFMTNSDKQVPVNEIVTECLNTVQHNSSCMKFLQKYSEYLNHANFCLKANKEKITGDIDNKEYSFQECTSVYNDEHGVDKNGNTTTRAYSGNSYLGRCKEWVDAAQQCQIYLINLYNQELSKSGITSKNKKYYKCLLDKLQTGNIDFPIEKMQESCK